MIATVINRIESDYEQVFTCLDEWFTGDTKLLNFNPPHGGWSIRQILEHISLTNHYLLILIRKGTAKAVRLAGTTTIDTTTLANYNLDSDRLEQIGQHGSFDWQRPAHMEPANDMDLNEVQNKIWLQKAESLGCLQQLKNGEGVLYKTMMTVNGLGKIDVYHYIWFLALHAKRHIGQMEKIKAEFEK